MNDHGESGWEKGEELLRGEILLVKSNRFSRLRWVYKSNLHYVRVNLPTTIPPNLRFKKVFCLLAPDKPKTKMGLSWGWNTISEFAREGLTFFFSFRLKSNCIILL